MEINENYLLITNIINELIVREKMQFTSRLFTQ